MNLVKAVRSAVDADNVILGSKETLNRVLSGDVKYVVVASNCERRAREDLSRFAEISNVEVQEFAGSSVELGEVCGKPFVVSMLAVLDGKKVESKAQRKK
jgi:large subunit ribosomal protein L30e